MKLSVVIPCWNDAEALADTLEKATRLRGIHEIIVADASDTAGCVEIARAAGARAVSCAVAGRGGQMNAGAAAATGDWLLFHHADSVLAQMHVEALAQCARDSRVVGGAFYRKFDSRLPLLDWLEPVARFLGEHGGTLYGDQSIFVRREHFERLGGWADIPLMEDVEFSKRLRRSGRTVQLDPPMVSSARRFEERGAWRASLQNGATILLFRCGVPPRMLHAWYYRGRGTSAPPENGLPARRRET